MTNEFVTEAQLERQLNDKLRREMPHGSVVIRGGAKQFSNEQLYALTQLIRDFDDFGFDSDADGLHDSGKLMFEGVAVFWQIDVSGKQRFDATSVAAKIEVPQGRIIIMLADEYETRSSMAINR